MSKRKYGIIWAALLLLLCSRDNVLAATLEPGERPRLSLVSPIENNSGFRVWGSKYYPSDVLSAKMTEYFYRGLREIPRVEAELTTAWSIGGKNKLASPHDLVVRLFLENFQYKKTDNLGSNLEWDVLLHMYVYNGNGTLIYDSVIEERDSRRYVLYNDMLENSPIYWDSFERTPCWSAIRKALDLASEELTQGYNGYRLVGNIVAKAERADGSLSVPKKEADKLWHITIGRNDTLREGDILTVTRATAVRTVDPEKPELHFPQIVGRVKVVFLKGQDAVVIVVKESRDAPIQLGDAVSAPLSGPRNRPYF